MRAEEPDATRDGAGRGDQFDAAVGARFHAAAEVRKRMVGARGLGPPVTGRSAGARCRWAAAKGRSTSSSPPEPAGQMAERGRWTVKHHLANARSKVGAETTAQLVWILAPRLPEPEPDGLA